MERDDLRNQVGEATSELSKLEALLSTRERERDALMEQYRIASHDAESFEVSYNLCCNHFRYVTPAYDLPSALSDLTLSQSIDFYPR